MKLNFEEFLDKEFDVYISGRNLYFNCPFCPGGDSGRNYWFKPDKEFVHRKNRKKYKGLGRCFKCETSHSVLSFVMQYKKMDVKNAIYFIEGENTDISVDELLAYFDILDKEFETDIESEIRAFDDGLSAELPRESNEDLPRKLVNWFTDIRSYPVELLKYLGVRWCPRSWTHADEPYLKGYSLKLRSLQDRAIFPQETEGNSGWQAYMYNPANKFYRKIKTLNPPQPVISKLLFMRQFVGDSDSLILNEGIFDALRTWTRGYTSLGLFGKNLSHFQAYYISKTKASEVCVCLDGGEKERIQAIRVALRLEDYCDKNVTIMYLPDGTDPDDCSKSQFVKSYGHRFDFVRNRVIYDANRRVVGYNKGYK